MATTSNSCFLLVFIVEINSDKVYSIRYGATMEDIKNLIADIFNITPHKIGIHRCNIGDVNSAYIAEFENKKIFMKVENSSDLPILYSGQIERELSGMKLCASKGVPCPNVLAYDLTGTSIFPKYIVTEFLDYPLLSKVWSTLDSVKKLNIKKQVLNSIDSLLQITYPQFGDIYKDGNIGCFETWSKALLGLIQIAVNDCERFGTFNQGEMNIILLAANECSYRLPNTETPCFSHMDLHWNNIFVEIKNDLYEVAGIIDFGSSLYAPKYSDLFRLQDGFLYGTEKFYDGISKSYSINNDQEFATDLFNVMDYYVFLSFTKQKGELVRKRIVEKCNDYLKNVEYDFKYISQHSYNK